jgi:hypothetical protein
VRLPISIIEFQPFHVKLFEPDPLALDSFRGFGTDPEAFIVSNSRGACRVCTFVDDDGMVLGVAGAFPQFVGVGGGCARLFIMPSVEVKAMCAVPFARAAHKMMDSLAGQWNLHRIEAVVMEGFTTGVRLVDFLGFRAVGTLEHYDLLGRNFVLYEKLYD